MTQQREQEVIVLWGRYQKPPPKGHWSDTPSNADKGVRELAQNGHTIISLHPAEIRWRFTSRFFGQRGVYRSTLLHVVRIARRSGAPIYTADRVWALMVARLKKMGILKNRLVYRWAGSDTDLDAIKGGLREAQADIDTIEQTEVCLFASWIFYTKLCLLMPAHSQKFQFWPTGVDSDFYLDLAKRTAQPSLRWDVVAIGSDSKRDWSLPIALSERGLKVALVTEDVKVKALLEARALKNNENLQLFFGVGFEESARIVLAGKCVLIATQPNIRFSGSTTVGVAAALSSPLVFDDREEAPSYGLVQGQNCEIFTRGDVESACNAVRQVVDDDEHRRRLASNIASLADALDLKHYAVALERCLRADWVKENFSLVLTP